MIRLFSHTETDFTHNGIHVLDDIALGDTCILSNGINEVYSLEMEVSIYNNSKWTDIESEMILKVPTPKGEQLFRIKEVVKGFSTIKIYGKHIFFDLENNFILDTNIVKKDGRSAIAQILGAMTNNMVNSFHGTSDISNFNNSRLVRKNVVTALIGDDDNSFLNRWGGELELNNFNFSINQRIGSDRGFQIRYGKNATGYEGNINTYNLCTRIVPVGFDGLMLEGTKWVDSPNIAKYPQIYTYEVKFEDIKVKENEDDEEGYNTIEEAREALREAAVNYFTSTECDLPSFSAVVNFITLRNTEEFKNVKALETVALGDDVSIYLSNIDVNASSRVVREKWNFFTKKHVELEIGEIKPNVFKQLINIKDTIDNIVESLGGNTWQDIINKSLDEATKLMEEGLKGSHVITMKNQIVIGDAPDIKDMVNCIVFNKNGIGFSNNGYLPDRLVSAMTIDGKINASCITTGELNAALIKTGVLMSANGKTWIDMDNGTFDFGGLLEFDGTEMKMKESAFKIVDSNDVTIAYIGQDNWMRLQGLEVFGLGECMQNRGPGTRSLKLITTDGGATHIDFNGNATDNYTVRLIREAGSEYLKMLTKGLSIQSFTGSTPCGVEIKSNGAAAYLDFSYNAIDDYNVRLIVNNNDRNLHCYGNGLAVHGNLQVTGNKNCVQNTENYGQVAFYAVEDCESYFTDRSMDLFTVKKTADGTFERVILIDNAFKETVNLKEYSYTVEVIKQGWGDYRIKEQTSDYFIVESDREDFTFKYIVTGRRKGYENVRLEECFYNYESEVSDEYENN